MTNDPMKLVDSGEYQELFIDELNWQAPDQKPITLTTEEGATLRAENVASHDGIRVWVCGERPGSAYEAALDRLIAKNTTDRLVIFHDEQEQVWRWPARRNKDSTVSDRLTSHRHRNGTADPKFEAKIDLIQLPFDIVVDATTVIDKVRQAFDVETRNESKRASRLMSNMYTALDTAYPPDIDDKRRNHEISVTLARLLFLMFGDDTDMWQPDAFRNLVQHATRRDGSDLADNLNTLFEQLNSPEAPQGPFQGFKYVNGGIFAEPLTLPELGSQFRDAILDACSVDWTDISPAIFGSMFQAVRDKETRRSLGEHYTSEENILKTLNPLFLDELRDELAHIRTLGKYEAHRLRKFREKLGRIRYMDPACGCGNFIIVAYRELRALELAALERLHEITGDNPMLLANIGLQVSLDHFYGIEIDEWPARIAETAMFLVDRQCDLKLAAALGYAPDRLPIQEQATIVVGNALTLDWADVCPPSQDTIVAGNPPFLGDHTRTKQQLAELHAAWGGDKVLSRMDYVTGWHARALQYFHDDDGIWAFVTTNSITQGDQVHRLFSAIFNSGWSIKFAHRTFAWTTEASGGAAVHCVIVGFTRNPPTRRRLFEYDHWRGAPTERTVGRINAYLVDGPNLLVSKRNAPLAADMPKVEYGSKPTDGGHLVVTPAEYEDVMKDPIAARHVRPYVGSRELINGQKRWCLWLVDASMGDIQQSPVLRERVARVGNERRESKADSTRAYPHDHLFRQFGITADEPIVCIPEVSSEHRPYLPVGHLDNGAIISNKVYGASDPTGLVFAIASSSMFITWMKTVGGRMKSDLSFSSTITWNNFPLAPLAAEQRAQIEEAGLGILAARAQNPELSLEDHYRPGAMTPRVAAAHRHLDSLVDRAFGLKTVTPTVLQRQEALFDAYEQLAGPTNADTDSSRS